MSDSVNQYASQVNTRQPDNFWDYFSNARNARNEQTANTTQTIGKKADLQRTSPYELDAVAQHLIIIQQHLEEVRTNLEKSKSNPVAREGVSSVKIALKECEVMQKSIDKIVETLSKSF